MFKVPPHILYPGIVFALLGMSFTTTAAILMASRSDDGAQIVDDYYARSLEWDQDQQVRQDSRALGWQLDVQLATLGSGQSHGSITLFDRDGQPVEGVEGTVEFRRPHRSNVVGTSALEAVEGRPGLYRFENLVSEHGLWDLTVATRASLPSSPGLTSYVVDLRREFSE